MQPEIIRAAGLLLPESTLARLQDLLAQPFNVPGLPSVSYELTTTADPDQARSWLRQNRHDLFLFHHPDAESEGLSLYQEALDHGRLPAAILLAPETANTNREPTQRAGSANVVITSQLSAAGLSQAIRFTMENNSLQRKIRKHTIHDPETGLFNTVEFERLLQEEIIRTERYSQQFTVAILNLIDWPSARGKLDKVEQLQIMQLFGEILVSNTRVLDRVGRLTQDRFRIILPEAEAEDALICIERLQTMVAGYSWQRLAAQTIELELRVGLISVPERAAELSAILEQLELFPATFDTEIRPGIFI